MSAVVGVAVFVVVVVVVRPKGIWPFKPAISVGVVGVVSVVVVVVVCMTVAFCLAELVVKRPCARTRDRPS